jgi:hypothetical protein
MPIFKKVTMQYHFKNYQADAKAPDTIIFARADMIFELNFELGITTVIHKMD